MIYWARLEQISENVGNVAAHSERNLKTNKNLIATYSNLKEWNRFAAATVLISIEMNMMTDNEFMTLDAPLPSEKDQVKSDK